MSFDTALTFVLAREGGYVHDPADPGGATNQGITQRTYDAWQDAHGFPRQDVQSIPLETVKGIYLQHYWTAAGCETLPDGPALALFDAAVNVGVARALGWWTDANGNVEALLWIRLAFYDDLARARPEMQHFLAGWLRRVILLREATR